MIEDPFVRLGPAFYTATTPELRQHYQMLWVNDELARSLQLDLTELPAIVAGQQPLAGAQPYAAAYAGHQFARFVPLLGDGRAQVIGYRQDQRGVGQFIQLKGAGPTAYARGGDGQCALGPALREYLFCEFMHLMDIPTTRALSVVLTGDEVMREYLVPGAIITRVAPSFLRVGSMSFAAGHGAVKALADLTIQLHYPDVASQTRPYLTLFGNIIKRQASLVARWMVIGFVHGVINTDNTALSGETIDYGPCAFINSLSGQTVFSAIDRHGRYDYYQQPAVTQWNLQVLAEAMWPLLKDGQTDEAVAAILNEQLMQFSTEFSTVFGTLKRQKLGFASISPEIESVVNRLWELMTTQGWDYTNTFRAITYHIAKSTTNLPDAYPPAFTAWWRDYRQLMVHQQTCVQSAVVMMRAVNPMLIPRNHALADAIDKAEAGDLQAIERLKAELEASVLFSDATTAPEDLAPVERIRFTSFCGT